MPTLNYLFEMTGFEGEEEENLSAQMGKDGATRRSLREISPPHDGGAGKSRLWQQVSMREILSRRGRNAVRSIHVVAHCDVPLAGLSWHSAPYMETVEGSYRETRN